MNLQAASLGLPIALRQKPLNSRELRRWRWASALIVIPVAAILHHSVFFRMTCMMNPFGPEYTLELVARWLTSDPSVPMAVLIALLTYAVGCRFDALRALVPPFLLAFAPLALWIWDIPGTARVVCRAAHDGRAMLGEGIPLSTRHFYMLGAVLYPVLLWVGLRRQASSAEESALLKDAALARSQATG